MTFRERIAADFNSVFLNEEEFAEEITYEGTAMKALLEDVIDMETRRVITSQQYITISSDADVGVAEPLSGHTGVARGRTFRVSEVMSDGVSMHRLLVDLGAPA